MSGGGNALIVVSIRHSVVLWCSVHRAGIQAPRSWQSLRFLSAAVLPTLPSLPPYTCAAGSNAADFAVLFQLAVAPNVQIGPFPIPISSVRALLACVYVHGIGLEGPPCCSCRGRAARESVDSPTSDNSSLSLPPPAPAPPSTWAAWIALRAFPQQGENAEGRCVPV